MQYRIKGRALSVPETGEGSPWNPKGADAPFGENASGLSRISSAELSSRLKECEEKAAMLRRELSRRTALDGGAETRPGRRKSSPAEVTFSCRDNMIRINTALTVGRPPADSWFLADLCEAELRAWESHHGRIAMQFPVYIIIKRKAAFWTQGYRDNENLETSKLINRLCALLGATDRADLVSYTSQFIRTQGTDDEGTEIVVMSCQLLNEHWQEFSL